MTSNLIIIKLFKQIVENKLYEFSTRLEYDHPEYGTLIFRSWMSYGYVSITLSLRNIQTNMFYDQDKGNVGIKNSRDDKLFLSLDDIQNDMDETETYIGELNQNGEKNGFGKLISNNKKRIGTWRKNQFTGWGREVRGEGELYEGRFLNGEFFFYY